MKALLTDGSGLTSRQVATQLAAAGHVVEVVSPTRVGLCGFTRHVRRVHPVPAFGRDPFGWLEATLAVLDTGGFDVLVPTQEQVTILARDGGRLPVPCALPSFESVLRVQDKVAQLRVLEELELRHPESAVVEPVAGWSRFPVFAKAPIGTASQGVRLVRDRAGLRAAERDFGGGPLVLQAPLAGPLVMVQAIFDSGRLVAWHASLREREGAGGGSSSKLSFSHPAIPVDLARLGEELDWHGALSLDAILTAEGPSYIDVNPRLVEPGSAWRAGVDLVDALLRVSLGSDVPVAAPPRAGVRTHQLLLAVLGAAQHGQGRRGVARELALAASSRGAYAGSAEELTPLRRDPLAVAPVAGAAIATLVSPGAYRLFTDGAVESYALTPEAWDRITSGVDGAQRIGYASVTHDPRRTLGQITRTRAARRRVV